MVWIWTIGGEATDSTAVVKYLNAVSNLNSSKFYDDEFDRGNPESSLVFDLIDGERVTIEGYLISEEWVIQSSENLSASIKDGALFKKIYKSISNFK